MSEFLQQLLGAIAGQLRFVSIEEFERLTGLDLVTALGLLKSQEGFEDLWQRINQLFQDQSRPGEFQQPVSPPPYSPPPPYFLD